MTDDNPLRKDVGFRRAGSLPAEIVKVDLRGSKGKYHFYVAVSFDTVEGVVDGEKVTIERPVEVFFPAGQAEGESQQWITSLMMTLSMLMRSGGDIAGALHNMRNVAWEKGQVRHGRRETSDGVKPLYHNSEAAALAYAIQDILNKRGFLDAEGNQVPVKVLAERYKTRNYKTILNSVEEVASEIVETFEATEQIFSSGKKCRECGANAVIKKDGCDFCQACGAVGACG
jgi:ribonucleoside-diphosphate reductase alpha chain